MNSAMTLQRRPMVLGTGSDGITRLDFERQLAVVLTVSGDVDERVIDEFRRNLADAVDSSTRRVVIDLSAVEFLGVAAALELVEWQASVPVASHEILVVAGPRCVDRALLATRAIDVLTFAPTLESALDTDSIFSATAV